MTDRNDSCVFCSLLVWCVRAGLDPRVHRMLRPGWMFGRRVDVSDGQYRFFREELPTLTAAALLFLALSHAVRHFSNNVRLSAFHRFASCGAARQHELALRCVRALDLFDSSPRC
jgi:hypothetical protein